MGALHRTLELQVLASFSAYNSIYHSRFLTARQEQQAIPMDDKYVLDKTAMDKAASGSNMLQDHYFLYCLLFDGLTTISKVIARM